MGGVGCTGGLRWDVGVLETSWGGVGGGGVGGTHVERGSWRRGTADVSERGRLGWKGRGYRNASQVAVVPVHHRTMHPGGLGVGVGEVKYIPVKHTCVSPQCQQVDSERFVSSVLAAESLAERGLAADEHDDRTVADLLVEQVGSLGRGDLGGQGGLGGKEMDLEGYNVHTHRHGG